MGYFNFYFIKKLLKNKKIKKFLILLILFIFIIFIRNSAFAVNLSSPINYIGFTSQQKTLCQTFLSNLNFSNISTYPNCMIYRPTDTTYEFTFMFYRNDMGYLYLSGNNTFTFSNWVSSGSNESQYYTYRLKSDGTYRGPSLNSGIGLRSFTVLDSSTIGTNKNIYTDSSGNTILYPDVEHSVVPIQIQNSSDISSWNYQTMNIIGDDLYADNSRRTVYYTLQSVVNNSFTSNLSIYKYGIKQEETNNYFTSLMIPRTQILTDYQIKPNDSIHFYLIQRIVNNETDEELTETYDLGTYTLGITQTEADNINSQAGMTQNQQQIEELQNINDNIEKTNDSLKDLENTIADPTIESGASDLPSTDVQDPTQNGIDNIFQSIYNAFCTGEAQDIVFPIPFTNKNITLSPYYVRDMLNNNGASWVYLLIQAFWGYLIGRYIVKDISHKITKIKSGDIENIENNNIKEEML